MRFDYQRRLAASILKVGLNRVYISPDPKEQENILDAITRDGVRALIRRNVIQKRAVRGVSRPDIWFNDRHQPATERPSGRKADAGGMAPEKARSTRARRGRRGGSASSAPCDGVSAN